MRRIFSVSISKKLSTVFSCFSNRNRGFVISFNWKNDHWNAAHLFCFYIQKISTVFLCSTLRSWRSVISFNWKNDQWNAAHLLCFYIQIRESESGSPTQGDPPAECNPIGHKILPDHTYDTIHTMHTIPCYTYHTIPYIPYIPYIHIYHTCIPCT